MLDEVWPTYWAGHLTVKIILSVLSGGQTICWKHCIKHGTVSISVLQYLSTYWQIQTPDTNIPNFIKMLDLVSGENRSPTSGLYFHSSQQKGTVWHHISLFLWIDWERLEQCISDIEAVRKMMYRCVTVGVIKVYWKHYALWYHLIP